MKHRTYFCISQLAIALSLAACSSSGIDQLSTPVRVSLIGLNDFHGNLQPPQGSVSVSAQDHTANSRVTAGGAAYLASLVASLKAQNPGNTLVVGAGDMIGASPLVSSLFHDEPTIDVLGAIGLDLSSVGNHEFDKGRDELLRMQKGGCFPRSADGSRGIVGVDTCMTDGRFDGAQFQYLAANVIDQKTGTTLFPAYQIKTVSGVKVGFIGLTLKDTPSVVTPAGVAGLRFNDEVATINALIPTLKQQGTSAIVVLIHQGGATTATSINDKTCPGFAGEIVDIADRLDPAVDVIISAHTHQEYVCFRPDGKLVTQAGFYGRIATNIELMIDPASKKVIRKDANNVATINEGGARDATGALIPLPAGYTAQKSDGATSALIQRYVDLTAPITGAVVGKISGKLDRRTSSAGESTLGDVIADAFLAASSDSSYGAKPAQIAFTNPGGVRADLDGGNQITFGQLYAVQPFGNNLVTMDVTGAQLHRLLEQQWEGKSAGGRVLPVSAGFTYSWDAGMPAGAAPGTGKRVVPGSMKLHGVPVTESATYRITVNSFMASGGDNFSVLNHGTHVQQGISDIDASSAYFKGREIVNVPRLDRITRLN